MFTVLSLKLCGCFGVRKKKRKLGTSQAGPHTSVMTKKKVTFKQDEDILKKKAKLHWIHRAGSSEDVKHDDSSTSSHEPKVVRGVKPDAVLVDGIKCRSQL